MGHEALIQHLIRNAESKREEILRRGREEGARLIAEAEEEGRRRARASEKAAAREIGRERRVRMNRIERERRRLLLRAGSSMAEDILARLEERLRRLPQEENYPGLVERLYLEVHPEIPEGDLTIRADTNAQAALRRRLEGRPVRFEPLPEGEIGGLEVSDAAGTVFIRNTLKSRFLKGRPELIVEINRALSETG